MQTYIGKYSTPQIVADLNDQRVLDEPTASDIAAICEDFSHNTIELDENRFFTQDFFPDSFFSDEYSCHPQSTLKEINSCSDTQKIYRPRQESCSTTSTTEDFFRYDGKTYRCVEDFFSTLEHSDTLSRSMNSTEQNNIIDFDRGRNLADNHSDNLADNPPEVVPAGQDSESLESVIARALKADTFPVAALPRENKKKAYQKSASGIRARSARFTVAESENTTAILPTHRLIFVVIAMMVCMLLAALDQTIVATAIRTIGDDLGGYSMQAWVTTAYLITSTLFTPLSAKLSDIFGRRRMYVIAILVFLLGSLLCSMCFTMTQLALARAIQGIGGGALMALSMTVVGDISTPKNRPKFQGAFSCVFATSSVVGPILGGLFAGQDRIWNITGWRWVFLINIPLAIVALLLVSLCMVIPVPRRHRTIDYMGALCLAVALIPLLIAAEQGQKWGWLSYPSIILYLVTALGLVSFVFSEYVRGEDAILPLRIFKNKTFSLGVVVSAVIGVELFSGTSLLPQYFQVVRGFSPTDAGLLAIPQVIGMTTSSILSGQLISRTGRYRHFTLYGSAVLCVVFGILYFLTETTPLWIILVLSFFIGFGLGNLVQPTIVAIQNSLSQSDMSISSSSAAFFRSIGGTIGIAVVLSVMFGNVTPYSSHKISDAMNDVHYRGIINIKAQGVDNTVSAAVDQKVAQALLHGDHERESLLVSMKNNSSIISQLDTELSRPIRAGFSRAIGLSFGVVLLSTLLGWLLLWAWKEEPING